MIKQRLKLARSASGLSLRDLSDKIDNLVTAQAIGKYERNEAQPGSKALIALARALDVSVDYLTGDQEMALKEVDFRKKKLTSVKEEAQVEAKVLHLLERYLIIEDLLALPSVEWDKPREAPFPVVNDISEADRAARSLRNHWGLGLDPISNLVELLEERGIKVLSFDLTNIDGLTARVSHSEKGFLPVIVVNKKDWGERQRFTLAHELGHMIIDVSRKLDEEKAAHRFAGAFLMPAETLWAEIGKHRKSIGLRELCELKELLGVSIQAIVYRCYDLGIFSKSLFRNLFEEFTRLGWRDYPYEEPLAMKVAEEPKRFERLCFRALAECVISEAKAAELLNISVHALNRLMNEPPDGDVEEMAEA